MINISNLKGFNLVDGMMNGIIGIVDGRVGIEDCCWQRRPSCGQSRQCRSWQRWDLGGWDWSWQLSGGQWWQCGIWKSCEGWDSW